MLFVSDACGNDITAVALAKHPLAQLVASQEGVWRRLLCWREFRTSRLHWRCGPLLPPGSRALACRARFERNCKWGIELKRRIGEARREAAGVFEC